MIPLFTSLMLSVATASENPDELNGQFQAKAMMPLVYSGVGIEVLTVLAASQQSGFLGGVDYLIFGTAAAAGATGLGVGLGMSGNRRMIADLESKGIDVETQYFRYAKWSRNLMVGTMLAGIATVDATKFDGLVLLCSPLFAIPMVVYTEKQRRVTLSTYESVADSGEQSENRSFQVSLIPTSNGVSFVGTF